MVAVNLSNVPACAKARTLTPGATIDGPGRGGMLRALADGTWRPAGELARATGIGVDVARRGLDAMVETGLLARRGQGRHAYYGVAAGGARAAARLDAAPGIVIPLPTRDAGLRNARTCYGHLAGQLGVALYRSWSQRGWLREDRETLRLDRAAFAPLLGAGWPRPDVERLLTLSGRPCIDWSERRPHAGGALGKAIAQQMFAAGWLLRRPGGSRAVALTDRGCRGCVALGLAVPARG